MKKNYKEETFYLASSLLDKFLANRAANYLSPPCLIQLAVICTLIAAKLEQPV